MNFNVGQHRRHCASAPQTAAYFCVDNTSAKEQRDAIALSVLHDALAWLLETSGGVAILDATNTTSSRRRKVLQTVADHVGVREHSQLRVVFLEVICYDVAVLHSNMVQKCTNSPDYRDMSLDAALDDLRQRIAEYERVYEPVDEDVEDATSPLGPISYIKLINLREKVGPRDVAVPLHILCVNKSGFPTLAGSLSSHFWQLAVQSGELFGGHTHRTASNFFSACGRV